MRQLLAASLVTVSLTPLCHAMDLAEAYRQALKNDPQWSANTNSYLAEKEKAGQSSGALLPTVALSGSLYKNHFSPETGASLNYNATQYGAQVRQPLFRADLWRDYQRSKTLTDVNEANYRQKEQDQVLRVSQAYVDVLRAQETLSTTQAEEAALKRQQEQAQKRFEVGLIAKTDVLEAQAQLDGAVANRISAEAALASSREVLATIVGGDPGTLDALRDDFTVTPPSPASAEEWARLANDKNPQLSAARLNYKAARQTQDVQRAGFLPTVDLVGSYSHVDNKVDAASSPGLFAQNGNRTAAGVEVQWPIFVGGRTSDAVRQATFAADAARDQVTATERQLNAQTRTAFLNVSADSYRVAARQQAVKSSEAALAATKAGYDVGTRNIVDVLLAERNVYAAKRDYANARYDYVINTLKLRAASGQLGEVDIKELNGWLTK